jgi:adenine-specific DNA-methyltransferase
MASELDVLLDKVEDPALRADLKRQVELLRSRRRFGLVFEEHLPERVQLPEHTIRRGTRVVLRDDDGEPREVIKVAKNKATVRSADGDTETIAVNDLVVVADFGEPIYPGLRRLGSLKAGGDKPAHVVIKGENHHVLEALQFTHAGKVDCIYIDPPYNTGARDWKYGNDYVDKDDAYRHSKWLSMMERRLVLAAQLLKPDGVMVVTIDEHEASRLGVLLTQLFPNALVQMVSIVINPSGVSSDGLSRVDEYGYFCFFGGSQPTPLSVDLLDDRPAGDAKAGKRNVRWEWLLRGGGSWYRESRPNLCYPVVLSADGTRIVDVGDPWTGDNESERPTSIDSLPLAWPVRSDGRLGIWRVDRRRLLELVEKGYAFVSDHSAERGTWTLRYLLSGTIEAIDAGELEVVGHGERGEVLVAGEKVSRAIPKTVWKSSRHIAGGAGGTQMLTALLGERNRFTYPKSVYAVEDTIMAAIGDRPDAVVLDFFAGSGTTTHAVARLNRGDGGTRQSIIVTNNEVADVEARRLRSTGRRPGDPEWEALGIFEHVRSRASRRRSTAAGRMARRYRPQRSTSTER